MITTTSVKEIVVSGIRPTGFLHLGNYFGAIKNFVSMQDTYQCFFFVADLHSLTTHPDTKTLSANVKKVIAEYLACGLNPNKSAIYCQSHVPQTAELYLLLATLAYKGELEKTTSFKEKIKIHQENINAALLTYPILMSADILLHRAHKVPVGKDQEQHLEMCRNFANRFNRRYENVFPEPIAFNFGDDLIKIPSLDGSGKMSKSENINATIYLTDNEEVITQKIAKAKTDAGPTEPNSLMPDYIQNIFYLLKIIADDDIYKQFLEDYNQCQIKYGTLKKSLANELIHFLKPIKEKADYFLNNDHILRNVLEQGKEKAITSAKKTLSEVYDKMNLIYFK